MGRQARIRGVHLVSIQVGRVRSNDAPGGPPKTAILKLPIDGAVRATRLGLLGDEVHDRRHHGGPDRAVLFASRATYPVFEARLGRALTPGAFGENLTVEGVSDADVCVGDRWRAGKAEFEVSSPRSPCGTLARHLADPGAVDAIGTPHRAGWYARVLVEGLVRAGDALTLVARPNSGWTIARIAAAKRDGVTPEVARTIAALAGLAEPWVAKFRDRGDGRGSSS